MLMQGQIVGSILFASNATNPAAARAAASMTAASSGAYNQLLTTSATTALNAWLNSSTAAAILRSSSYVGLTIPSGFSTTPINVTNVVVINATVTDATVESLLGITSSSVHYALEVWLNISVQVGYGVAAVSTTSSRRRLLQQALGGSDQLPGGDSALAVHGSSHVEHRLGMGEGMGQLGFEKPLVGGHPDTDALTADPALLLPVSADQGFGGLMHEAGALPWALLAGDLDAQLRALARAAVGHPGKRARQLQQSLGASWLSPLDLQLAMLKAAFAQTAQCNATAVALQLGTTSSLSSLNCPTSSTITLLTDLLAASTSASNPALSVLTVSAPQGSRSTTTVDSSSGVRASLASGLSILLHGYEVQIAAMRAMTVKTINTVDTLGSRMAGTYIKAFIKAGQNYIQATTTLANSALAIFDRTLSSTAASVRLSAYTQLVQTSLAAAKQAENALQASPSFQSAVAALAPNCTSRDRRGNARFVFLLAANDSSKSSGTTMEVLNETASDCPLQLRQGATGYCMNQWNGYPVVQVSSMPDRQTIGEQVIGRRRTVGIGGNVVVGGLLLHQVRISGPAWSAVSNCITLNGHVPVCTSAGLNSQ